MIKFQNPVMKPASTSTIFPRPGRPRTCRRRRRVPHGGEDAVVWARGLPDPDPRTGRGIRRVTLTREGAREVREPPLSGMASVRLGAWRAPSGLAGAGPSPARHDPDGSEIPAVPARTIRRGVQWPSAWARSGLTRCRTRRVLQLPHRATTNPVAHRRDPPPPLHSAMAHLACVSEACGRFADRRKSASRRAAPRGLDSAADVDANSSRRAATPRRGSPVPQRARPGGCWVNCGCAGRRDSGLPRERAGGPHGALLGSCVALRRKPPDAVPWEILDV